MSQARRVVSPLTTPYSKCMTPSTTGLWRKLWFCEQHCTVCTMWPDFLSTVLVKSFAHLNRIFFLASLEEIDKLWKWWTVYRSFHTPPCSKLAPLSHWGSQKIHSIKYAKLLTSTVYGSLPGAISASLVLCVIIDLKEGGTSQMGCPIGKVLVLRIIKGPWIMEPSDTTGSLKSFTGGLKKSSVLRKCGLPCPGLHQYILHIMNCKRIVNVSLCIGNTIRTRSI